MDRRGYALLCDFYEFTMSNGYFKNGHAGKITYFDVFFREVPDGGGFAIAAGLQQVIDYIENLHFREDEIYFLKQKGIFGSDFLNYLSEFKFTGDIYAVPEGTPVFPHEPLLTVRAPAIEAQLMETFVLLTLNHQSLIATKPIVWYARPRADLWRNSVRAGPRGLTEPFWEHGRLI
jgi:nicotinate phosphoribosyltransferase